MKCVSSIKESDFNEKNGSTFSHLLKVMAEGADCCLTVKYPFSFDDSPFNLMKYDTVIGTVGNQK